MATIKAIEGRSVHQIQSGQVIVDLCSVVKELVENSLDAGATSIDVRFRNHGLESIEVQDNGKGISPDDYETVALKHHTSKLSSYEDLTSLDTFGFRGEALSSLCALSKFHVLTARAEDGAVGKRLDFEVSGRLKGTTVAAAQRGTTVSVNELFFSLPVRRKELEKNIKREYGKVIGLLHAYACICVGVRFSVSNQMPKGKKFAVFSTKSNTTTKENIVNVYGAKTLLALIKLDLRLEMQPSAGPSTQTTRNWSTQPSDRSVEVRVEGHISKPVFGEGRQAPDRQMFFVNSRPCALPQVSKAINEVYKSYNVTQSPFIFANFIMDTNAYDVNVSPDKRTIMLHDQTALLEKLKETLTELFDETDHTVPQSTLPNRRLPSYKPLAVPKQRSQESATPDAERQADPGVGDSDQVSESSDNGPGTRRRSANETTKTSQPSLISNWVGRNTEGRRELPRAQKSNGDLSKDKQKLVETMQQHDINKLESYEEANGPMSAHIHNFDDMRPQSSACRGLQDDLGNRREIPAQAAEGKQDISTSRAPEPDPLSSPYDDLFSQRPPQVTRATSQIAAPAAPTIADQQEQSDCAPTRNIEPLATKQSPEPHIAAVKLGSQRSTPGPVANAFDRMRSKRTPLQTAEITVGDTTTTTVIGSSSAFKKRRIHEPQNSQSIAKFGASPLLARGLRNFAAPGTQMAHLDSSGVPPSPTWQAQVESESEGEDEEDEQQSDEEGLFVSSAKPAVPVAASDDPTSDPLDQLTSAPPDDDDLDDDYVDERERRLQEDEKVAQLIQEAEEAARRPTEDNLRRASQVFKKSSNHSQSTLKLKQTLNPSAADLERAAAALQAGMVASGNPMPFGTTVVKDELDDGSAEAKLSLSVSKSDFERMVIIGQFNLGFILAIRPASSYEDQDELFIIDQHAADEKYNYERLQRTVTLQSQRLVRPKALELTAIEEEIILNSPDALRANGFEVEMVNPVDEDDEHEIASPGNRCRLLTLPISGEKTFDTSDLEELLHLLSEVPAGSSDIPRPKKVQRMLAMRACRSSIMVGKTLTMRDMGKVVKHMGEMEKPWNCPHGRPTMRHLAGLGAWHGWSEGQSINEYEDEATAGFVKDDGKTDWKGWLMS